jgi:hypothetical protein
MSLYVCDCIGLRKYLFIFYDPMQSQTYKDIEVDHMYLRNPIQSQTYKDIEVDHMYLRPIQSQTYKDIEYRKYM